MTTSDFGELYYEEQKKLYNERLYFRDESRTYDYDIVDELTRYIEPMTYGVINSPAIFIKCQRSGWKGNISDFIIQYLKHLNEEAIASIKRFKGPPKSVIDCYESPLGIQLPVAKMTVHAMEYCYEQYYRFLKAARQDIYEGKVLTNQSILLEPYVVSINNMFGHPGKLRFVTKCEIASMDYHFYIQPVYIEWLEPTRAPGRYSKIMLPISLN